MAKEFCTEVKRVFWNIYKALKSLSGLIIILVLYNIIGAVIFVHIEAPNEQREYELTTKETGSKHEHLIRVLSNLTSVLDRTEYDFLRNETEILIRKYKIEADENEYEKSWDFWKAMFFCGTIYTTIGYGNIYPKTSLGKVVAIFYAVFGIPLAMRVLAEIGKKLSNVLKYFYFLVMRCCKGRKHKSKRYTAKDKPKDITISVELNDNETNGLKVQEVENEEVDTEDEKLPVFVPICILVMYIVLGGVMYTLWEEWGYLDAFYFVFISVSTIGFGDITPAHTKYFIVTSIYVFIGLSLLSMCINVMIEFYIISLRAAVDQVDKVTNKMKKGCRCGSRRQSI